MLNPPYILPIGNFCITAMNHYIALAVPEAAFFLRLLPPVSRWTRRWASNSHLDTSNMLAGALVSVGYDATTRTSTLCRKRPVSARVFFSPVRPTLYAQESTGFIAAWLKARGSWHTKLKKKFAIPWRSVRCLQPKELQTRRHASCRYGRRYQAYFGSATP